jgi:diguanylate cyclase (GGDEF)-like protein
MDVHGTWLCPEPLDRARFVDMERRMRRIRNLVFLAMGAGVVLLSVFWGWQVFGLFAAVSLLIPLIDRRIAASRTPEWWLMVLTVGGILAIGGAVALTGGARSAALPWLVVPVVAATAVFTVRGIALAVAVAMLTALASTLLVDAAATVAAPEYLVATIVLIASVTMYVTGLMRAEVRHRGESVLDPLTGLLNRATLAQRFEEVRQQAVLAHKPVSFVLFDLDAFKRVNDTYGHETGDAVLRDVAYELRKALRSFELAYRVGGEELLLILPGTDEAEAAVLAERVRRRVAASRPGGISVTISAGVSAGFGDGLSYERLFERADQRLYEAKSSGRNRVVPTPHAATPALRLAG